LAAQRWGVRQFFFVIKKNSNIFNMLKLAGRTQPRQYFSIERSIPLGHLLGWKRQILG
jgi:hypothetical protein